MNIDYKDVLCTIKELADGTEEYKRGFAEGMATLFIIIKTLNILSSKSKGGE